MLMRRHSIDQVKGRVLNERESGLGVRDFLLQRREVSWRAIWLWNCARARIGPNVLRNAECEGGVRGRYAVPDRKEGVVH